MRFISEKKGEPAWMLEWRLESSIGAGRPCPSRPGPRCTTPRSTSRTTTEIDRGAQEPRRVDPELLRTYARLGIPLREREILAGVQGSRVAVDAVFDSVSVVTTFKEELGKAGVIFCGISEAIRNHPDLVKTPSVTIQLTTSW